MSALHEAVTDLVTRLSGAGVPVTADPDQVGSQVAAHGVVAYVQPPEVEARVLSRGMRLVTEVFLLGAPPGGHTQMQAVWDKLGPAMDALSVRQSRLTTQSAGGVTYPAYQLAVTQNTPC